MTPTVRAITGALRGRLINGLITNEVMAELLLQASNANVNSKHFRSHLPHCSTTMLRVHNDLCGFCMVSRR